MEVGVKPEEKRWERHFELAAVTFIEGWNKVSTHFRSFKYLFEQNRGWICWPEIPSEMMLLSTSTMLFLLKLLWPLISVLLKRLSRTLNICTSRTSAWSYKPSDLISKSSRAGISLCDVPAPDLNICDMWNIQLLLLSQPAAPWPRLTRHSEWTLLIRAGSVCFSARNRPMTICYWNVCCMSTVSGTVLDGNSFIVWWTSYGQHGNKWVSEYMNSKPSARQYSSSSSSSSSSELCKAFKFNQCWHKVLYIIL